MKSTYVNLCHNPRFSLWPFGTSGFTVTGKTGAARWKMERTSANDLVTVSKGTNSSTTKYDSWLKGAPNMTLTITGLDAATRLRIRQFHEKGDVFGQSLMAMTIIASGPAGASFYFGAGENYAKLTTLGNDSNGDPILVTETKFFPFDDPQFEYLRITPFESPSTTGTFRLHHVQCETVEEPSQVSSLEIRQDWEEWEIIRRYVTPITQGMFGTGAGTTSIRVPVVAPPGGWRVLPEIATEGRATTVNATLNSSGTVINAATATYSIVSNPTANTNGLVVALGGFTSAASASQYVIGPETSPICYLNADYF